MGEGRRTAKTQLGPLCSILGFPLPTQPPPPPPHLAGVVRGAYTGAVKAHLTFSICKLLTFLGFYYTLLKRCSEMRNLLEVTRTRET